MNKPNFICIGAAKAGTTTLYDVLKDHTEIYLPPIKETHFFDDPKYWEKGTEWYFNEYFTGVRDEPAVGEMTPSYVYFDEVPQRIHKTLGPDVKLILMLRNPVTRALSHYKMHYSRGNEKLPLREALQIESERMSNSDYQTRARHSYLDRGYYAKQMKRWLEFFKLEQIHIIIFEDYLKNKEATYQAVEKFLGVSHQNLNYEQRSNFGGVPRNKFINHILYRSKVVQKVSKVFFPSEKIRKTFKMWLKAKNLKEGKLDIPIDMTEKEIYQEYFTQDIQELESLLNLNLDIWKYS